MQRITGGLLNDTTYFQFGHRWVNFFGFLSETKGYRHPKLREFHAQITKVPILLQA